LFLTTPPTLLNQLNFFKRFSQNGYRLQNFTIPSLVETGNFFRDFLSLYTTTEFKRLGGIMADAFDVNVSPVKFDPVV